MFYQNVLEVSDRSYYTDLLQKLTGKGRSYWARFPLYLLRRFCQKELTLKDAVKIFEERRF